MSTNPSTKRYTIDRVKRGKSQAMVRIIQINALDIESLRQETFRLFGFNPDSSVTLELLREFLIRSALDEAFPT